MERNRSPDTGSSGNAHNGTRMIALSHKNNCACASPYVMPKDALSVLFMGLFILFVAVGLMVFPGTVIAAVGLDGEYLGKGIKWACHRHLRFAACKGSYCG